MNSIKTRHSGPNRQCLSSTLQPFSIFFRDIIVDILAAFGRKLLTTGDTLIPLRFAQATQNIVLGNAILDDSVDKTGVKIVARANGAHHVVVLGHVVSLTETVLCPHFDGIGAVRTDEFLAIKANLCGINMLGFGHTIEDRKVVTATSYDIRILQILNQIRRNLHDFVLVGRTVIDVVVKNCASFVGIFQEVGHLWTHDGIDREERTEHDDVVGIDLGVYKLQSIMGMIFVKEVVGVVLFIEKSQRDGRFTIGKHVDIIGINAILFQKINDAAAHSVVAGFGNESSVYAGPA